MKKVVCINNNDAPELKEGGIYTAEDCLIYPMCYRLSEVPRDPADGMLCSYGKRRFIPLSNIDEMELLAERYGVFAENNFGE